MNKLRVFWGNLRSSFWFVPSLILAVSIVIVVVLIELDYTGVRPWLVRWPRLFGAGAAGARSDSERVGMSRRMKTWPNRLCPGGPG